MSYTIAVAGKGGTGKTTVSALIVRYLKNSGDSPVLAVDADPTANLGDVIGLTVEASIGSTLEKFREDLVNLPQGVPRNEYLQSKLNEVIAEGEKVDLVTMGRKGGEGCYCYPNQVLREYMNLLAKSYPYVVLDNEAGMEHLSRKIAQNLDVLLLVSDPTIRGVKTAGDLMVLIRELKLDIKRIYLVISRTPSELNPIVLKEIEKQGLKLIQLIPEDSLVLDYNIHSRPLTDLPETSLAVKAVSDLMKKVL